MNTNNSGKDRPARGERPKSGFGTRGGDARPKRAFSSSAPRSTSPRPFASRSGRDGGTRAQYSPRPYTPRDSRDGDTRGTRPSRPFSQWTRPYTPRAGASAPRDFSRPRTPGSFGPMRKTGASAAFRGAPSGDRSPRTGSTYPKRDGARPMRSSGNRPSAYTPRAREAEKPAFVRAPFAPRQEKREPKSDLPRILKGDVTRVDTFMRGYERKTTPDAAPERKRPRKTQLATYEKNKSVTPTTSWGGVSEWYDEHLHSEDTYHAKLILPNLLRLVEPKPKDKILDLACGQGYFTRAFAEKGATMTGVDISEELITIAKQESSTITYHVGSAEDLSMISDKSVNKVLIVLAIQNIEHTQALCAEAVRILKTGGEFHIVMNHPAFRIPKRSSWGYEDKTEVQFRRIDSYISESKEAIAMHPGIKDSPTTLSFHRPLQYYFKALAKAGFAVDRFEEWTSHKSSDSGPRAKAENRARKEIPLFLYMRASKQKS